MRLHQTTIKTYYAGASLRDNFNNYKLYWFANRYRNINLV